MTGDTRVSRGFHFYFRHHVPVPPFASSSPDDAAYARSTRPAWSRLLRHVPVDVLLSTQPTVQPSALSAHKALFDEPRTSDFTFVDASPGACGMSVAISPGARPAATTSRKLTATRTEWIPLRAFADLACLSAYLHSRTPALDILSRAAWLGRTGVSRTGRWCTSSTRRDLYEERSLDSAAISHGVAEKRELRDVYALVSLKRALRRRSREQFHSHHACTDYRCPRNSSFPSCLPLARLRSSTRKSFLRKSARNRSAP